MLGDATDSVANLTRLIKNARDVIAHHGCEVSRFISVSAVGGGQDIFLVDDGTSAQELFLSVNSDWRMFRIKIKSLSYLTALTRLGF